MTFLSLNKLSRHFDDFVAVESLDLDIERGEFISLLGPSGCGKTTTLQMIAGFVNPTSGSIVLDGKDITAQRPERRGMGVVFQSYALFPHMTVEANVGFGLEMRGVGRGDRARQIAEALELVRLGGLGKRYPRELSGGQRQRVAIARALAIRPQLLLLDEPMSNLDAKLREDMHVELRAIQRHLGITTLLVTHDQVEAMTMSDRIAVMFGGKIVQLAKPFDAYEAPRSPFASNFLGKTNSLQGNVVGNNQRCTVVNVNALELTIPHHGQHVAGNVHVFVRPEKLRLGAAGEGIPGVVKARLFLGNHWMLQVDTALGPMTASVPNVGSMPPVEGANVGVCWNEDDMRVLSRQEVAHG
ncbi:MULTISPECIES: ABC transporter ATP-binding protein [unclassified Burkholderia]|uniref:ABC transporter ATP-binding protein n=1 Tax=unclassified Burkholderia TaxID=2613784 RepID=UPI002AAF7FA0|nr:MULTISPECIES: ABC transporter ATP-binding protein [unclassified Burkholderia]